MDSGSVPQITSARRPPECWSAAMRALSWPVVARNTLTFTPGSILESPFTTAVTVYCVTDVAEGRYQLGITLDSEVRSAIAEGSPVTMEWPADGAISLYSPIAETVAATGGTNTAAQAFLSYVLSPAGQAVIGKTGWQPVLPGIAGPPQPAGATVVYPGWSALFGRQQQILQQYQAIFGA